MQRRHMLYTLAALPAASVSAAASSAGGNDLMNPYEEVDWDSCDFVPSMSHQHQGQTDASRAVFHDMGYRHFAFSNYYPSAPTYPLPKAYLESHPDVITAPNAEHHSFTDSSLHFNALGSLLATGYGSSVDRKSTAAAPLDHRFENLNLFTDTRPWLGVYRLDIRLAPKATAGQSASPEAVVTIEGAVECAMKESYADRGPVKERILPAGNHAIYLRTTAESISVHLAYDNASLTITQFRLMQGTNRPWRDVFRAALDGEEVAGKRSGGLLYKDGGGITLNHPTAKVEDYTTYLDFDSRVLGIEVWNQLTSGFGSNKGFYDNNPGPHIHFYRLWDDILRTGRRCWGFFVKDHNTYGRGRNILLLPDSAAADREAAALRAYRQGTFFGSVASLAANEAGEIIAPYDQSAFRFSRITVRRDAANQATAIQVAVADNDPEQRPQVQIRFVTDQGVAAIADASEAVLELPRDDAGRLMPLFVRVEAFAYPHTHSGGQPLTPEIMRGLNVYDISQIHHRMAGRKASTGSTGPQLRTPIPTVDMIFSQPLVRV